MKPSPPVPRHRWQAVRTTGKVLLGLVIVVGLGAALALGLTVVRLWPELPPLDKVTHYEPSSH